MYSNKLKELREEKQLNQIELANLINISRSCYSHYETEDDIISITHLCELCDYFHVSLDYIFEFTNQKNYLNPSKKINKKLAAERLKEFRKENHLTQVKLAEIWKTTQPTITYYETGKQIISTSFLYDICSKYKISADYLLGKTDNPKYLK